MMERKTRALGRVVAQSLVCTSALLMAGCGGEMPFTGQLKVAGDPPPPPPKPEPPEPKRVEVRDNKIEIHEKIQFEYNKSDIKEESYDLLNEIVQVIQDNPHIKKIRIEGHTDSDGTNQYNKRLSDARANSVMDYLVEHGVDAGRLKAKGFGEEKPIATNDTDQGKAKNRRVEFNIVKQDVTQKKVEIDPETGEEKVLKKEKKTIDDKPSLAKPGEKPGKSKPTLAKPKQ